jgi:hypothetical protein
MSPIVGVSISNLTVPKCEIFHRSDFQDFYTIKSLWGWLWGLKYFFKYLFRGSFRATRFLSHMFSLICKENFIFWVRAIFLLSFRVRNWCVHWTYASGTNACTEGSPLKNMLNICVRNCFVPWACASGTDVCTEHARQELMHTLSMRIRN